MLGEQSKFTGLKLFMLVSTASIVFKSFGFKYVTNMLKQRNPVKRLGLHRVGHFNNPTPKLMHQSLITRKQEKFIIVGDIHGCFHELNDLLSLCDWRKGVDIVIFVGDLVNKGPFSIDVVRFARINRVYCVRGNHDDAALMHALNYQKGIQPPESYSYVMEFTT